MDFDAEKSYLGTLCKRGHTYKRTGKSLRKLKKGKKSGCCIECTNLLKRTRYKENTRASMRIWRGKNREKCRDYSRKWEASNRPRRIKATRRGPYNQNRDLSRIKQQRELYNRLFLSDTYVKKVIYRHSGIWVNDPIIIQVKREHILMHRELKKAKEVLDGQDDSIGDK